MLPGGILPNGKSEAIIKTEGMIKGIDYIITNLQIMKKVKFIYKKNWDYRLYEVDGEKVLTVEFFASFADYERSFYLTKSI